MLDIVDRSRHRALANCDKALFHFLGRDACITPDHAHYRDVDIWKDVCGHSRDGHHSDQHDQNGHDRKAVRPPQS